MMCAQSVSREWETTGEKEREREMGIYMREKYLNRVRFHAWWERARRDRHTALLVARKAAASRLTVAARIIPDESVYKREIEKERRRENEVEVEREKGDEEEKDSSVRPGRNSQRVRERRTGLSRKDPKR